MNIRESTEQDESAIKELILESFDDSENESVARLAMELLHDPSAAPVLSLVAETAGRIIGHILFTKVSVPKTSVKNAYICAPLGVASEYQGKGIGGALLREGFKTLQQRGVEFVMLLGDPNYYSRFGLHTRHNIKTPYPIDYPEAWMTIELQENALLGIEGTLQCANALQDPKHW